MNDAISKHLAVSGGSGKDEYTRQFSAMIRSTDKQLWLAYDAALNRESPLNGVAVRFPRYREGAKKEIRVSEQEAKLLLTIELAKGSFTCSAEVPTQNEYQFSGKGKRSALTDLAVYMPSGKHLCNMEFKKGGFSDVGKKRKSIAKDVEKLLREKSDGYWFHTLEKVNRETLGRLWSVFVADLKERGQHFKKELSKKRLTFHFTVLRPGFSVERELQIDPEAIGDNWLQDVRAIEYSVSKGMLTIHRKNSWLVHRRERN